MTEPLGIRCDFSDAIEGQVPAYDYLDEDEELRDDHLENLIRPHDRAPRRLRWLSALGQFVKQATRLRDTDTAYFLDDFPAGYVYLEDVSRASGNRYRAEASLWGHPSGRHFSSPGEFQKHLLWLLLDLQHIQANCLCKLCKQHRADAQTAKVQLGMPFVERAPLMTGMSEVALVLMIRSRNDLARDTAPHSPVFRLFEVVRHLGKGQYYMVVSSRLLPVQDKSQPGQIAAFVKMPFYTLVGMESPHETLTPVAQNELAPYCAIAESQAAAVLPRSPFACAAASPIGKYQVQYADEPMAESIGPKYTGFYFGPEKIYRSDIIRIASREGDRTKYKLMQISDIFLEVETKTYKVRGDVFAFRFKQAAASTKADAAPDPRKIPPQILQHGAITNLDVSFLNKPQTQWEVALADVMGRDYPLTCLPRTGNKFASLGSARVTTLQSCRADALSDELRDKIDNLLRVEQHKSTQSPRRPVSDSLVSPAKSAWPPPPLPYVTNGSAAAPGSALQAKGSTRLVTPDLVDKTDNPKQPPMSTPRSNAKVVIRSSQGQTPKASPRKPALWNPRRASHGAAANGSTKDIFNHEHSTAKPRLPAPSTQVMASPERLPERRRVSRQLASDGESYGSSDRPTVVHRKRSTKLSVGESSHGKPRVLVSESGSSQTPIDKQRPVSSTKNVKAKAPVSESEEDSVRIVEPARRPQNGGSSAKRRRTVAISSDSDSDAQRAEQRPKRERKRLSTTTDHQSSPRRPGDDRSRRQPQEQTEPLLRSDSSTSIRRVRGGPNMASKAERRSSKVAADAPNASIGSAIKRDQQAANDRPGDTSRVNVSSDRRTMNGDKLQPTKRLDNAGKVGTTEVKPKASVPVKTVSLTPKPVVDPHRAVPHQLSTNTVDEVDLFATTASEFDSDDEV